MLDCQVILLPWLARKMRMCCGELRTLCNDKLHSYHSHPESLAVELRELLHNVATFQQVKVQVMHLQILNVHVINHQFSWQVICASTAVGIATINEALASLYFTLSTCLPALQCCKLQTIRCKICGIKCKHAREASEINFCLAHSHKCWSCF